MWRDVILLFVFIKRDIQQLLCLKLSFFLVVCMWILVLTCYLIFFSVFDIIQYSHNTTTILSHSTFI